MSTEPIWHRAAALSEFEATRKLAREIAGHKILFCRSGAEIFAIRNVCTHLGEPLEQGRLMAGQIHCPYHGACFDLRTGAAMSGPAVYGVRCFPVEIRAGEIFVLAEAV